MSTGPGLLGLSVFVNERRTNSEVDGAEAVQQELGLQGHHGVDARQEGVDALRRLRVLGADGLQGEAVDAEGEPERRFALEHQLDAASRLDEVGRVDDRVVVDRLGKSRLTGGKLPRISSDVTVFLSALNAMSWRSSVSVMATEMVPL